MTETDTPTRCGFVTIIGAPNAGKSTLTNALMGTKVTIVSPKVQTTRMRVRGILMRGATQIILIDTPGIFAPKRRLDRAMVAAAWDGQRDADITALIVDASKKDVPGQVEHILKKLPLEGKTCILILNKTDQMAKDKLLPLTKELNERYPFEATFMISALKGDGVDDIAEWIAKRLPEGVYMYPEDQLTDLSERLLAAEITREKLFHQMHEEIPYALTVETESWEEFDDGSVKVGQLIIIAREAHKPIVIGKGGSRLKNIGLQSRLELEKILGRRVHLNLLVRVRENWLDDPERFSIWGLDHNA
ncbi:MAG: GTP-binding protein Era [Micavibrio sp.]|nr:GTP-binding protein Era [Micavibrio sp.]